MAEFCKCGSVMISGSCTNKRCSNKLVVPPKVKRVAAPKTAAIRATTPKAETKIPKVPKASKCISYHISELPLRDNAN